MNLTEKLRFTTTFMENFVSSLWDIGIEQFFTEPPLFIGNNNNGYDYLIFFLVFIYSSIHSTTSWSIKKLKKELDYEI